MYKDLIDQLRATESRSKRQLLDRAAAAIERLEAERAWISIEERLPPVGVNVLIADGAYMSVWSFEKVSGCIDDYVWEDNDGRWHSLREATHWMPLPEVPQEVHHGE